MWRWLYKGVTSALLWFLILRYTLWRKDSRGGQHTVHAGDRLVRVLRRLSPEQFPHVLPFILQVVPTSLASYIARKTLSIYSPPKEALLSIADTLENADEFDLAEMFLWRGARVFENDTEMWFRLFLCSFRHVWVSLSPDEWTRAYYRFKRVATEAPSVLREDERVGAYYLFDGADGKNLLLAWRFIDYLWLYGHLEEARSQLSYWWSLLRQHANVPEQMVRSVAWSMLGLGMFATVASDAHMERTCAAYVDVARWFLNREPLSMPAREGEWTSLSIYTLWAQALTAGHVKPSSFYWMWRRLSRRDYRDLVYQCLFAASLPVARSKVREKLRRRLRDPMWGVFLPYLHFLCVAAIRLGWREEALDIRMRIEQFGVPYAAKADLDRLLEATGYRVSTNHG